MANVSRHQTEDSHPEVYAANVDTRIDHRVHMLAQQKGSNAINVENTAILGKMCRKSANPTIHEVKETVASDETYLCGSTVTIAVLRGKSTSASTMSKVIP